MGTPHLAAKHLALKGVRRIAALHKPWLRAARRVTRATEHLGYRAAEYRALREVARVAEGREPILVGPWLAEVGYEALYWTPFVRWFVREYRVPPDRVTVVSRGGTGAWYGEVADGYVDLFDLFTPEALAARNEGRRRDVEAGGQKQSALSALDRDIAGAVAARTGVPRYRMLHPSLMFRAFGQFWLGNQAPDFLWRHTRYERVSVPRPTGLALPDHYTAVKLYTGRALPDAAGTRGLLRRIVERLAATGPVVLLETGFAADEHDDHDLGAIPNVRRVAAGSPATNLAVQTGVVAGASRFVGTCGGLAWLAPLLGVPTTALYLDDRLLATHLAVARQVYRAVEAAPFSTVDLRAAGAIGVPPARA